MRARHPRGQHLVTCSGPANCEEYLAVLNMRPHEHAQWLTEDLRLRFASMRENSTAADPQFPPPDAYAASIAAIRASIKRPAPYTTPSSFESASSTTQSYEPPDSYGLKRGGQ